MIKILLNTLPTFIESGKYSRLDIKVETYKNNTKTDKHNKDYNLRFVQTLGLETFTVYVDIKTIDTDSIVSVSVFSYNTRTGETKYRITIDKTPIDKTDALTKGLIEETLLEFIKDVFSGRIERCDIFDNKVLNITKLSKVLQLSSDTFRGTNLYIQKGSDNKSIATLFELYDFKTKEITRLKLGSKGTDTITNIVASGITNTPKIGNGGVLEEQDVYYKLLNHTINNNRLNKQYK